MSTAHSPAEGRTLLRRVPTPVFVVGYGLLVVAMLISVVMLASYRPAADTAETKQQNPAQPWNPVPMDVDNVRASVRDYLITDVETGTTRTGIMMRGAATEYAAANVDEFIGHVSRLLEQNCIDTLVLTTPDNLRLNFLGFCFSTLPQTTLTPFTQLALDEDADSVSVVHYFSGAGNEIALNWLDVPNERKADQLEKLWEAHPRPEGLDRLKFAAYTDDGVRVRESVDGKGTVIIRAPLEFTTSASPTLPPAPRR